MSRLAYFKNVTPSVGLDATQNQMLNSLSGLIASKAEQADLTSGLAQKADSTALTYALSSKADTSAVNSALASKADTSSVNSALADKADISVVNSALADKADKTTVGISLASKLATSVYDARVVNEAVFFDSVSNSIVLQDASGVELNYVALGLVPQ